MTIALLAGIVIFCAVVACAWEINERNIDREIARLRAAQRASREAREIAWAAAHPELVAQGCPPPPTPEDMIIYTKRGGAW